MTTRRNLGDRPIYLSEAILYNKLSFESTEEKPFEGIFIKSGVDLPRKILNMTGQELSLGNDNQIKINSEIKIKVPIEVDADDPLSVINQTKQNLLLGSAANENVDFFIQRTNGIFSESIQGTGILACIANDYQYAVLTPYGEILEEGETQPEEFNTPVLILRKNEFATSMLTVDIIGDEYPEGNPEKYNNLARIIDSAGSKAVIWDQENDGKDSGLDADFVRGKQALKILDEAPDSISEVGDEGDFAIKDYNGKTYAMIFTQDKWVWFEAKTSIFPWE